MASYLQAAPVKLDHCAANVASYAFQNPIFGPVSGVVPPASMHVGPNRPGLSVQAARTLLCHH